MSEPDIYQQIRKNEKQNQTKPQIDFQIPNTDDIDILVKALYDLQGMVRSYQTNRNERSDFVEIKDQLINKIRILLNEIDSPEAESIKAKLYNDLGIFLP